MKINEARMLEILGKSKDVFLLEPQYKRKYPPLGLMKISSYIKERGGKVKFSREYKGERCDLICITSLFTYDAEKVIGAIRQAANSGAKILIGGVFASLMTKYLERQVTALNEDSLFDIPLNSIFIFAGYSRELDMCVPDYSIDWGIDDKWKDYSFTFTSRGCPNKCPYCAVWRIEPEYWINPGWRNHIIGDKKIAMISDNNLSSAPDSHFEDVISFLSERGERVVFDNGLDCKLIDKGKARLLSRLKYDGTGLRLAFDRVEEDGTFQEAVELLKSAGIPKSSIMAYIIFNFNDTPQEANYRMEECVKLGIRPYPQCYTPLNKMNRKDKYIGKYWSAGLLKAFRFFWLMAGYYGKMKFDEFAKSEYNDKYILTEDDWELFYAK